MQITAAEICRSAKNLAPLESQKDYRDRLAAFIRIHLARLDALDNGINYSALPVNSMLIVAQTGCGKSFTAARLCEAAGVNLITVDCSSLTRTGYKGCNLGDLLYSHCSSESKLKNTIILFDEVDKMRIDNPEGNPQANFLKLFDGIIQVDPRSSNATTINLSRVSFLFAGAFEGLETIIRRRLAPRRIGFSAQTEDPALQTDPLSLATMADIREYGFMDELLGRIGSLLYIPPLTVSDYRTLIKGSRGSVSARYSNLLRSSGVSLSISDNACVHIAKEASRSCMGARAVDPIVYDCLQDAFERLDSDASINHVTLSCRGDRLSLVYGHGERMDTENFETSEDGENSGGEKSSEEVQEPPLLADVSIARYLEDGELMMEFCRLSLEILDLPSRADRSSFHSFLRCCLYLMDTLSEEDKVLSSIIKLAESTKPEPSGESCFDRVISARLDSQKLKENNAKRNKLFEAQCDYRGKRSEEDHLLWVQAAKDLRRGWCRKLLKTAA